MLARVLTHVDPPPDRRSGARESLACPLPGRIPLLNLSVAMIECGDGGFSVRSTSYLPIGSVHSFRFTMADRRQISIKARVVHSLLASSSTPPLFLIGFESE
jgi:hypothetical protein